MEKIAILYHDDWDGMASAWAAHGADLVAGVDDMQLTQLRHGDPFPEVEGAERVYVLDFCPEMDAIARLANANAEVIIIDHHKSAIEQMAGVELPENVTAHLESEYHGKPVSGCWLTWKTLLPNEPMPALIRYVNDHDVWLFEQTDSAAIRAEMQCWPLSMASCNELNLQLSGDISEPAARGEAILEYQSTILDEAIAKAFEIEIDGVTGLAAEMPVRSMQSVVAGELKAKFGCAFGLLPDGRWSYSLRSSGDVDVARLAESQGGGGHAKAAGFQSTKSPLDFSPRKEAAVKKRTEAVRISKSAPEKQVIYYLVSEPGTVDAHGHSLEPEEIERALHSYMAGARKLKVEHKRPMPGGAVVVEGYVAPCDLPRFHGDDVDPPIPAGASIIAVHYPDREVWEELRDTDHGISWAGWAKEETDGASA